MFTLDIFSHEMVFFVESTTFQGRGNFFLQFVFCNLKICMCERFFRFNCNQTNLESILQSRSYSHLQTYCFFVVIFDTFSISIIEINLMTSFLLSKNLQNVLRVPHLTICVSSVSLQGAHRATYADSVDTFCLSCKNQGLRRKI